MSVKVFEYLPTLLNRANDAVASGQVDSRTGMDTNAGGLVLGDALSLLDFEARQNCDPSVSLLYSGQYRRIMVDPGATAANVGTGKSAFVAPGAFMVGISLLTAGSGQTPGTYQLIGNGGGGSGAAIAVVVGSGGAVTSASLLTGGIGYTTAPTFTLNAGGTTATFRAMMDFNSYKVTTADIAGINVQIPRGVFLNPITPGNCGWIQESGTASCLLGATVTSATVGASLTPVAAGNGTFQATASPNNNGWAQVGVAIDQPSANNLCRALLTLPGFPG